MNTATEIAYLPLTRSELIFLSNVTKLHGSYTAAKEIKNKIEHLTTRTKIITPEQIIQVVCNFQQVSLKDFDSECRKFELSVARACAAKIIKDYFPVMHLSRIGRMMGNRQHCSIIHYLKLVNDVKEYREAYFKIREHIARKQSE